jgi:hypothetical protein
MNYQRRVWAIRIILTAIVLVALGTMMVVRAVPILVIVPPVLALVVFVIWRIVVNRRTRVIFAFYVTANEILTDADGSRYHFEIAGAIRNGERIVRAMPDAPPLTRFALGALYYATGDYNGAAEHLALAAEEEILKESRHLKPSRQLRRYVSRLRRMERRPRLYAKINAAVASLQEMQHERAGRLLAESQRQLRRVVEAYENEIGEQSNAPRNAFPITKTRSLKSITAPPTISEVLNEVYQEEPNAS